MLYLSLLLFIVTCVLGSNVCENLVVLNKDEVKELLIPSHPRIDSEEFCQWTVVAEEDRRIIISCPFNEGPDTKTNKSDQCGAKITLRIGGEQEVSYCSDKPFGRVGLSYRMVIKYQNDFRKTFNRTSDIKCYLYAVLKSRWDPVDLKEKTAIDLKGYNECDFFIKLQKNDVVRLATLKDEGEEPLWRKCRWTVVAPQGSKASVTCPFTDKPPDPITMQMLPCTGEFTIITIQNTVTYTCKDKSFSETSNKNRIVVEYQRLVRKPYENFECYVHSKSPDDETSTDTVKSLLYEDCDHLVELTERTALKSPNYPKDVKPGTACRWTVLAPENNRIALNCLSPKKPRYADFISTELPCHGEINTTLANGKTTRHCQDKGFYQFSDNHLLTITYRNPSGDPADAFQCFVYPEVKKPANECKDCTGIEKLDFTSCDKSVNIDDVGRTEELASPMSQGSSSCRWTVNFPNGTQVYLSCGFPNQTPANADCKGYFTVYPTGYLESGKMYCSDLPFSERSTASDLSMVLTYSGQPDLPKEPFTCNVTAYYEKCEQHITLPRLKYNQSYPLLTPNWPTEISPWKSCIWHYEAAPEYQITLICDDNPHPVENCMNVSRTGDEDFTDGYFRCIQNKFSETSVSNKMSLKYLNITDTSKPREYIGCKLYLDRKPSVELCNCGWSPTYHPSRTRRVEGGTSTLPDEFPMMAALVNIKDNRHLFCGATIISDRYALTSARCLAEANETQYEVGLLVGSHDLSLESTILYHVDQMISHPDFNDEEGTPHKGDIGLVHVQETIQFNNHVRPVCLPFHNMDNTFVDETSIVLGWGTKINHHEQNILQKLDASVEDDLECKYFDESFPDSEHICIRHQHESICEADSGGPILWVDPNTGLLKIIGILFRKNGCAGHFNTKATEVVAFLDWIEDNTPGVKFCKDA